MLQHPCWAPPDHGIGSICLYGLEVQKLDSMHWWDRTKNLWHRTDDPEKAPQLHRITLSIAPCSNGVIFSPVRSPVICQWNLPWQKKKTFQALNRRCFFKEMNLTPSNPCTVVVLQTFQATVSHYAHLDFFTFRNGSLHVTQQTDSSFVRLHDLVLSHSEWHSGDARWWVVVKELH